MTSLLSDIHKAILEIQKGAPELIKKTKKKTPNNKRSSSSKKEDEKENKCASRSTFIPLLCWYLVTSASRSSNLQWWSSLVSPKLALSFVRSMGREGQDTSAPSTHTFLNRGPQEYNFVRNSVSAANQIYWQGKEGWHSRWWVTMGA